MGKKPFAGAFGNKVTAYDAGMKPKHACKIQRMSKADHACWVPKTHRGLHAKFVLKRSHRDLVCHTLPLCHGRHENQPRLGWLQLSCQGLWTFAGVLFQGQHEQGQPHSYVKSTPAKDPRKSKWNTIDRTLYVGKGGGIHTSSSNACAHSLRGKPSDFTLPSIHWSQICDLAQMSCAVAFALMMGQGEVGRVVWSVHGPIHLAHKNANCFPTAAACTKQNCARIQPYNTYQDMIWTSRCYLAWRQIFQSLLN